MYPPRVEAPIQFLTLEIGLPTVALTKFGLLTGFPPNHTVFQCCQVSTTEMWNGSHGKDEKIAHHNYCFVCDPVLNILEALHSSRNHLISFHLRIVTDVEVRDSGASTTPRKLPVDRSNVQEFLLHGFLVQLVHVVRIFFKELPDK